MTPIISRLAKANHAVEQLVAHKARELSLTPRQMQVLCALAEHEGMTAAEIGRALGVEKTTMAHVVSRMVKVKLIKQKAAKDDGRAEQNFLTKSGEANAVKINRIVHGIERTVQDVVWGGGKDFNWMLDAIADLWKP